MRIGREALEDRIAGQAERSDVGARVSSDPLVHRHAVQDGGHLCLRRRHVQRRGAAPAFEVFAQEGQANTVVVNEIRREHVPGLDLTLDAEVHLRGVGNFEPAAAD